MNPTPELQVNDKLAQLLPPLTDDQQRGLEADILKNGCLSPLIVWDGVLIDGHHRYAICRKHGIAFEIEEMEFDTLDDARFWMWQHHKNRRNMSPYALAEIAVQFGPNEAARAKERQRGGQGGILLCQHADKAKHHANKELAKRAGVSHDTIAKAKVIVAKATPEVKEQLRRGETSIRTAYADIRRREKEEAREQRRQDNRLQIIESPKVDHDLGRFSTIVIDPPWDWGDEGDGDQLGRARPTYGTMRLEKLMELPVNQLADEDCHLYLWITNRSLPKGFQLLDQWGFRYVTCVTWCKPWFGLGNYFRGSTEHVLFGVKGSQPLKRKNAGTWFTAPRGPLGHSSKPLEFYDLVESCSPGPYLEMFARSQREDWSSWGAESNAAA